MANPETGAKRELGGEFIADLKDGLLKPLLSLVKADNTLMLAIRDNYLNIYYRGGNLLKLIREGDSKYKAEFNWGYAPKDGEDKYNDLTFIKEEIAYLKETLSENYISNDEDIKKRLTAFPRLKQIMDFYLTKKENLEREFQQLVVRENNFSGLSNQTDYFIVDIEAAYPGARFDLLAAKWPATQKDRRNDQVSLAFIEMKYGETALTGNAGLIEHLGDIKKLVKNRGHLDELRETVQTQLIQLNDLGLLRHTRTENRAFEVTADNPEVILLLAGYPLQSQRLKNLFEDKKDELERYSKEAPFNLKFHLPHSAGYGLFCDDMVDLGAFKEYLGF